MTRDIRHLVFETKLPFNGESFKVQEDVEVSLYTGLGAKPGELKIANAWKGPDDSWQVSSFSVYVTNFEEYEAKWLIEAEKKARKANEDAIEMAATEERSKAYEMSKLPVAIEAAFDTDGEWMNRLIRAAINDNHFDDVRFKYFLVAFAKVPFGEKREGVELRKLLKPMVSAAKEQARDEYPDEYSDEEDKDDFYESHFDDIAQYFAEQF